MSRGLWFVAGAASGIYAVAKARRTAQAFTPQGIGARLAALRAGAAVFASSVAEGRAEREADLRLQLEHSAQLPRLIGPPTPRRAEPSGARPVAMTDLEASTHGHR
jgi:hypothetical protein